MLSCPTPATTPITSHPDSDPESRVLEAEQQVLRDEQALVSEVSDMIEEAMRLQGRIKRLHGRLSRNQGLDLEDAETAGLRDLVSVVDNGSDAPGTILGACSEEFRALFWQADLVISKGQGNYETLSNENQEVFHLLKAKCPVIARDIGCEVGEIVVLHRGPTAAL